MQDVLGLADTGKPLWHTEGLGGYTRTWHSYVVDAVDDPYSRRPGAPTFAPEDAAEAGVRAMANILAAGAEKVFWYWSPWEDGGSIRPDRYTWFEFDGQLKPHAAAYATCAWFLEDGDPIGRVETDAVTVCLFARGDDAVAVAWAASEAGTALPLPKEATAYDLMGSRIEPETGVLALSTSPVYVAMPAERALAWSNSLQEQGRLS